MRLFLRSVEFKSLQIGKGAVIITASFYYVSLLTWRIIVEDVYDVRISFTKRAVKPLPLGMGI